MHIEIWEGAVGWHWHFKNKGRITADAEAFPTKGNAMRAAKAVVKAVHGKGLTVQFKQHESEGFTVVQWSAH